MPESEVMNPFEAVDPEIIDSMKSCTIPYLRSVIIQIITQYPEMADPVKELLVNAKGNRGNDRVNKLLAEDEEPVSFINYQDFADQILDVFQSIQNEVEVAVDYKANAFNPITIKEVFEL